METAIHGLVGKVRQLHVEMNTLRKEKGLDVTLKSHLAARYSGLTPDHLYNELKIDPRIATVEYLLSLDEDTKWLVPEVIRDAIRKGFIEGPIYPDLVAADEPATSKSVVVPYINLSAVTFKDVAEGGSIPKSKVTYGEKTVNLQTKGVGIDIGYDCLKYTSINLLSEHLAQVGINLGSLKDAMAIYCLINGDSSLDKDGAAVDESAAVIGVEDTDDGLTYDDLLEAFMGMSAMVATPSSQVTTSTLAKKILKMAEFKTRAAGTTEMTVRLKRPIPTETNLFPDSRVAVGTNILVSKARCMNVVTSEPLMVEDDKIISRRIVESVATFTSQFYIMNRFGRVILDESKLFSGYGWPAWFRPIYQTL